MRLFLYGTLTDPAVARRVAGEDRFVREARPALLAGYRRVILRGTPYPTLVPDREAAVHGLVTEVTPAVLRRLHAYEGPLYRFVTVRVLCEGATLAARAWIAHRTRATAPGTARSRRAAPP
ncbi:gamma-glutamylcyclotransferase family protein [Elioraea sp.]|uniref:gamma-glutamylcyclotransferase family protein n=1 Tax=Elioraea sp. TaxID=2185103 RepID=UPI0021DD4FEE|nr:gamma-glutamylcyclotransferase family protein [Elioraea sp.]GIX10399.1 MAG: hypothetical protein KatS3mg116_2109 [Elioraea sp.]